MSSRLLVSVFEFELVLVIRIAFSNIPIIRYIITKVSHLSCGGNEINVISYHVSE